MDGLSWARSLESHRDTGTDPECNGRKRETAKVSTDDDDVEDPRFTAERAELKASSTSKIEEAEKQLKKCVCSDDLICYG